MDCVIMPLSDDNQKLEDAVANTTLIDWNEKICIDLICPRALKILKRLQMRLGLSYVKIMPTPTFYYDRSMPPFSDMR